MPTTLPHAESDLAHEVAKTVRHTLLGDTVLARDGVVIMPSPAGSIEVVVTASTDEGQPCYHAIVSEVRIERALGLLRQKGLLAGALERFRNIAGSPPSDPNPPYLFATAESYEALVMRVLDLWLAATHLIAFAAGVRAVVRPVIDPSATALAAATRTLEDQLERARANAMLLDQHHSEHRLVEAGLIRMQKFAMSETARPIIESYTDHIARGVRNIQ